MAMFIGDIASVRTSRETALLTEYSRLLPNLSSAFPHLPIRGSYSPVYIFAEADSSRAELARTERWSHRANDESNHSRGKPGTTWSYPSWQ